MPRSTSRRLAVSNMDRGIKMIKNLAQFWRENLSSKLTAQWADNLADYIKGLTASSKFMDQVYEHLASLIYTMDMAPSKAITIFPHLANMGSLTSTMKTMYDWDQSLIDLVQTTQKVRPKKVKIKTFQPFLQSQAKLEVSQYFQRILGHAVVSERDAAENQEPYTAINTAADITAEDNECLAESAEILDMENDPERFLNLGGMIGNDQGMMAQPADIDDIMSIVSCNTSKSSRIMSAFQDQHQLDMNISQLDVIYDDKLVLPFQVESSTPQLKPLPEEEQKIICTHWDPILEEKCDQEALNGQYWCNEHQGLQFDRADDFLKEMKGINAEIMYNLSESIQVENTENVVMSVFQYATSFDGPTNAFLHGRTNMERLLKVAYEVYRANPTSEFKTFSEQLYRANFKEVSYPAIFWYHVHLSLKSLMDQIKHPINQPWVNAIPMLTLKLGAAQGFVDPTKAISKVDWFNKTYPAIDTKMADDILKKDIQRTEGLRLYIFILSRFLDKNVRHICLSKSFTMYYYKFYYLGTQVEISFLF